MSPSRAYRTVTAPERRNRPLWVGGDTSSVGAEMMRMLKQDMQDPEWAHRLRTCIPRVHELFATLSGVLHPPADEHRLTVKINRPVVKKLKQAIGRIWTCLLPILTQNRYIDGDDEELHQHVESAFTACMERLVSYVILRTLGTKDDMTDHREQATMQTALAYVAHWLADHHRFTTNIHGIELTYDDLVDAMRCRSILDPQQPTAWTIAPNQQGGMFLLEWGWKFVAFLVFVIGGLLFYRAGSVKTRGPPFRDSLNMWDDTSGMTAVRAPNVAAGPCDDALFIIGHSGMQMVPQSPKFNDLKLFENRSTWIVNYNQRGDYAYASQERAFLEVLRGLLISGEDELMKSVLLNPSDYKNILFIQQLVNENLKATDSKKHVHYNVTQPDGSKAPFMTYTMTNEDTDFTGFFSAGVYTLDGIRALCRNLTYESWYPIRDVDADALIPFEQIASCYKHACYPTPARIRESCGTHLRTIREWAFDIKNKFATTSYHVLDLYPGPAFNKRLVVYNLGCRSISEREGDRLTRNKGLHRQKYLSSMSRINNEIHNGHARPW
jgi:hypothetical protein